MNNNNEMYGGSICVTDLMNMLNQQHSAFSKSAKNNKVYGNIIVWKNAEPDEFGNSISIQLSSLKDKRESEKEKFGKAYIGNAKKLETSKPVSTKDLPSSGWDANVPVQTTQNASEITEPIDDLPF